MNEDFIKRIDYVFCESDYDGLDEDDEFSNDKEYNYTFASGTVLSLIIYSYGGIDFKLIDPKTNEFDKVIPNMKKRKRFQSHDVEITEDEAMKIIFYYILTPEFKNNESSVLSLFSSFYVAEPLPDLDTIKNYINMYKSNLTDTKERVMELTEIYNLAYEILTTGDLPDNEADVYNLDGFIDAVTWD